VTSAGDDTEASAASPASRSRGQFLELASASWTDVRDALARFGVGLGAGIGAGIGDGRAATTPTSEARAVAIVPVGSTEAHGPHLPLATDSIISTEMARRGAMKLAARGELAVLFPTQHYVVTDWASEFPGTLGLSRDAASAVVLEVCLGARAMGFHDVVLTNAHLEQDNVLVLRDVAARFAERAGVPLLFPDVTRRRNAERLGDEFRSGSCHAGRYETSLVLAVRPELVRLHLAQSLPEVFVPMHERARDGAKSFREAGLVDAYCGAPALASADEGDALFDVLSTMVVEVVDEAARASARA
jgi:creatinine amidohydrolase